MLDVYDTIEKKFLIEFSRGSFTKTLTEQELFEFYVFNHHNITLSFDEILNQLERGNSVVGDDCDYDFMTGSHVIVGDLTIKNINVPPKILLRNGYTNYQNGSSCRHDDKYINEAGGIKFWFCRKCKQDLGNA